MIFVEYLFFLGPLLKYLMIICLNLVRNFRNYKNEIYKRYITLFFFISCSIIF